MTDINAKSQSRRKFLSLSLLTGVGLVSGKVNAQSETESGETVQMLTSEGKLVEVNKSLLREGSVKKQATKKDVMGWIHGNKT